VFEIHDTVIRTSLFLLLAVPLAAAAGECRVADPELQGFYEGGCSNGLADGEGYAKGIAEYRGWFRKGLKEGRGVKTWPWGDRYEGMFKDDRRDGFGIYSWGAGTRWAGERYEGRFKADLREGWGVYTWPNGDRYEGPWVQNVRQGISVMEARRQTAKKEMDKVFKVAGATVCGRLPGQPAALAGWVKGKVESWDEDSIAIRVTEAPYGTNLQGTAIGAGTVISDRMENWTLCY